MTAALARLVERHRGGVVVAVSHADPIKAALAHALGMHLDLFQRLNVAPGSITTIAYSGGPPMVLGVNALGDGVPA
jgi:broad specificity phosphatase PhoE